MCRRTPMCRKLDFVLIEAGEFEFPKGQFMTCNDWRLDLRTASTSSYSLPS